jgi:TRAP-type C4-dicarboxylate transport system substrate-binding protein
MDGKRRNLVILLIGVIAVLAGCAVQGEPVVNKEGGAPQGKIRLTLAMGEGQSEAATFAKAVERISDGTIAVDVTDSWAKPDPNYETILIKDVAAGKAQLGMVGIRAFDTVGVNAFQGLMAPFLIDTTGLHEKVLRSDIARGLLGQLGSAGVVGLGYQFEHLRRPIGISRDFRSVKDFAGAKFGIRASKVSEMTIKALGGEPVVTTPGSGRGLDGIEGSLSTAKDLMADGVRSVTDNVVLWPRPYVYFADANAFGQLGSAQQKVLRDAADSAFSESIGTIAGSQTEIHGIVCNTNLKFVSSSEVDRAALLAAVQPVYAELEKDANTKAVIDAIKAMRGDATQAEALEPCAAKPSAPVLGGKSPIDGNWTTSFTKEEFVNSPLLYDQGEINDQNWGDIRLTLHGGQVEYVQKNAIDHYTTTGTFEVKDDVVTFRFNTGGNAGETFTMRWSLYKGTLTFERDAALGIAPTPYLVKPWTKAP